MRNIRSIRDLAPNRSLFFVTAVLTTTCSFICRSAQSAQPTTTTLSIPQNSVPAHTAVTLNATVTNRSNRSVTPGLVVFHDGKIQLGFSQLQKNGVATMQIVLGIGPHEITASFAGTTIYASSSTPVAQLVTVGGSLASSTTLTNPGKTIQAKITGKGSLTTPSGTVSFVDQITGYRLGPVTLGSSTVGQSFTIQASGNAGKAPWAIASGDFNRDGIPDLAVSNDNANTVTILLGQGDGTFHVASTPSVGKQPHSIAVADFNSDGIPDLATANYDDSSVSVLLGQGGGTFAAPVTINVGAEPCTVIVADFDRNGIPDLATANYGSSTVTILLGQGDGTFVHTSADPLQVDPSPQAIAAGDFNGDGFPDLAVSSIWDSYLTILLGDGAGGFKQASTPGTASDPTDIAVGDFNGDGYLDLATANPDSNFANNGANTVSVLLGNGDGSFRTTPALAVGNNPRSINISDFNGDGIPDLATTADEGSIATILLGNGDGTFSVSPISGTASFGIAVGDFNGDGMPDLATANFSNDAATVLLNQVTHTSTAKLTNPNIPGTGAHPVFAQYAGDGLYAASKSESVLIVASPVATVLSLAVPSAATAGQSIQLVASLSPFAEQSLITNGETVTFLSGTTVLGTGVLINGTATLAITFSTPGVYNVTARYGGDVNFAAAISAAQRLTVQASSPKSTM